MDNILLSLVFVGISIVLSILFAMIIPVGKDIYVKLLVNNLSWLVVFIAFVIFFTNSWIVFMLGVFYIIGCLQMSLGYFQPVNH